MTLKAAIKERRTIDDSRKAIAIAAIAPMKRALHEGGTQFTDLGVAKGQDGYMARLSLDHGAFGPVTVSALSRSPQEYIVSRKRGDATRVGTDLTSTMRCIAELMTEELK